MPTRPSRLERITNLVLALLETPRPLSLREIGSAVAGYPPEPGALRQAFERDKRTLRDGGIPVAVERIDGDDQVGYRILPEAYYLPDLGLSSDEQEALGFALAAVRLEGGTSTDVASKLGLSASPELPPIALLPSLPALGDLQEAIRLRSVAQFDYHGRPRRVEGYGLVFKQGNWYFIGRDQSTAEADQVRTFRVDRIEGEVGMVESDHYELPDDLDVSSELRLSAFSPTTEDEAGTPVVLDVDVREVSNVSSLLGTDAIESRSTDGSARFSVDIGDEEAFLSFVLGLGDAVEVLEPQRLRSAVIERLSNVVAGSAAKR